jgi:hypothetical protein
VVHKFPLGGVNAKLIVRYGDFTEPLSRVAKALTEVRSPGHVCVCLCLIDMIKARKYAANEHQSAMIGEYIASYVPVWALI